MWVTVMLVTSLCWWLYDGDRFEMLVTESLCWWFSQCFKSVTNILDRSPISQTCHQHIWSPTSVTNIDVTHGSTYRSDLLIVVDFPQSWFQTFSSYYSRVMKGLKFFLLGDLVEYLIMINLVLNTRIIIWNKIFGFGLFWKTLWFL